MRDKKPNDDRATQVTSAPSLNFGRHPPFVLGGGFQISPSIPAPAALLYRHRCAKMGGGLIFLVLFVGVALGALGWFAIPKGANQV